MKTKLDRKPALYYRAKINGAWRFIAAMPGDSIVAEHPEGHFYIRHRVGDKRQFDKVTGDPLAALKAANMDALGDSLELLVANPNAGDNPNTKPATESPFFADVDAYIKALRGEDKSHGAAEHARLVLREEFPTMVPEVSRLKARNVRPEHLRRYLDALEQNANSDRTRFNKYSRVVSWLKRLGVDTKPFRKLRPEFDEPEVETYSREEIDALMAACDVRDDSRDTTPEGYMRVAITLLLRLGLREQEATHAEWSNIDGQVFTVRPNARRGFTPKKNKTRHITIPSDVQALLTEWKSVTKGEDTNLILGIGGNRDRVNGHLLRWVQRVAKRAGVKDTRLHKFRSTYLTALARSNWITPDIMNFAGHDSYDSTKRYLEAAKVTSPKRWQRLTRFGSRKTLKIASGRFWTCRRVNRRSATHPWAILGQHRSSLRNEQRIIHLAVCRRQYSAALNAC